MTPRKPVFAAAMLSVAAFSLTGAPAAAQDNAPPFEGRWAIVAIADSGHCDEAYNVPIDVRDGAVSYAGWFGVEADGSIDEEGRLTMRLAHAGDVVDARGRLGAETGAGKWASPGCAGTWQARKTS